MRRLVPVIALLALGAVACLRPMRGDPNRIADDSPHLAADSTLITVTVDNQGYDNVTVYVDGLDGGFQRLGTVNGFSQTLFRLGSRWTPGIPYRLRAEVARQNSLALQPLVSAGIVAQSGQQVVWTLHWDLRNAALEIY